ncbi:MAG: hypothetical protein AAF208_02070 [Cyanobacteria bacterium P01_A01_bin.45]
MEKMLYKSQSSNIKFIKSAVAVATLMIISVGLISCRNRQNSFNRPNQTPQNNNPTIFPNNRDSNSDSNNNDNNNNNNNDRRRDFNDRNRDSNDRNNNDRNNNDRNNDNRRRNDTNIRGRRRNGRSHPCNF